MAYAAVYIIAIKKLMGYFLLILLPPCDCEKCALMIDMCNRRRSRPLKEPVRLKPTFLLSYLHQQGPNYGAEKLERL